jgi:hypothetical protein
VPSAEAQRTSGHGQHANNDDTEEEDEGQRVAGIIVGGKKGTRKRSAVRADRDLTASLLDPMCERCAAEVAIFPDLRCWLYKNSPVGKCGDCKKKGKPCSPVSNEISNDLRQRTLG